MQVSSLQTGLFRASCVQQFKLNLWMPDNTTVGAWIREKEPEQASIRYHICEAVIAVGQPCFPVSVVYTLLTDSDVSQALLQQAKNLLLSWL